MNEKITNHIFNKSGNSDKIFEKYISQLITHIKIKNKNFIWSLPVLKIIKSNINLLFLIFIVFILYCSNYFINLFLFFILFDSIILSIIILQDSKNKIVCSRLAKNVISIFILTLNITGSLISIGLVLLIYFSFNTYMSNSIFKVIKLIINYIGLTIPVFKDLYPSISLIDHNKQFESSKSDSTTTSTTSSTSDSDSDSDSTESSKSNKKYKNKEHKFYKKFINELKTD